MVFQNNLLMAAASTGGVSGDGLWMSGKNAQGQLGLGDTTNRSELTQVGEDTDWARVSLNSGDRNMGVVKTDGTLWTWGQGHSGSTGHGSTTNYSSPVQVGSDTDWHSVYGYGGAGFSMLALKTTGAIYSTGSNYAGAGGRGSEGNVSSFTQIGSLTDWLNSNFDDDSYADGYPITVAAGQYSFWVIKSDNTLWSCGYNNFGQLGVGNTTNYSSPVQVGTDTNWASLPASAGEANGMCAIRTDGTLWTWGNNSSGQLGLGDTTSRSSPVQVGSLTNYKTFTKGANTIFFTNTSNELWGFGAGAIGGGGWGNTSNYSSPIQIGSDTDWHNVIGGAYTGYATKSDGTLWAWGRNHYGQLGIGSTTGNSSPVQVGTTGEYHTDFTNNCIGGGYNSVQNCATSGK